MVDKTKKLPVNKTATGKPVGHTIDTNPQLKKENVIELENDGVAIPPSDTIVERKALTIQQRQARARILQRIEPKLQRAREVAKKKIATDAQLKNRAMIKARDLLKKRLAARRDVDYADLSTSEKIQVDKAVEKKVALIKKIAQRLLPSVRKAEYDRIKSFISGAKLQDLSTPATIVQSYENDFDLEDLTETIIETFDVIDEAIDNKNVDILLRAGLADRKNLQKYRRAVGNMDDSLKNPQYRDYLLKILRKLMEIVTNDVNIFSRTRAILQKKKLSENALISLQKKAEKYNVPLDVAVEVYARGVDQWETNSITEMTYEQYGFSRLNSFLNGGKAAELDIDLVEYVGTYNPLNVAKGGPLTQSGTRKKSIPYSKPPSATIAPRIRNRIRNLRKSARSSGKDIASTARPHKSYTSNRFTHKKYISSEYDMELDNNFSDFINEAKNSPKQREIGTTSLRKIYTKDTPCQEENDIDNAFSVSEEIKGWKNAKQGKNIKMVRLKNDGGESKLSDATTLHGSEEDAVERHDRMTKSNPSKKIKHNLYVDGKLVRTLGEDVELDESVYEYSLKKTGMKQTIAHPDGKPTYDLHYNGEKVATIAPYSGHRDKKNPGSRIVTSRKNITSYSINFEKDKGPQGYHKGYFSSQFTNYDNPKKAHKSAVELHSKWKKEKVNEDVELDEKWIGNIQKWKQDVNDKHGSDVAFKNYKFELKETQNISYSQHAVSIYPNGQGSDVGDRVKTSEPTRIPTRTAIGNEPDKDESFFNSPEKKKYVSGMVEKIKSGKSLPPVMSTPHPSGSSNNIVLDGNHRAFAHKQAGSSHIPAVHVSHDNIHLASHDYDHPKQSFHPLSSFKEKDGSYDMEKPRPELNGKTLNHYFARTEVNEDVELDEMSGANMNRRKLVQHLKGIGWLSKSSGSGGDHEVFEHPNSSKTIAIPRHKDLKAPLVLNILKQSKIMDKKANEEIVHDKCGTSDCCNQCDTSINESFTMAFDYFGKPSYAPTASDLMMKAKGGYETHPDVEIVETVNAIRERIVSTFDRYVLTEDEDYEGKMARGELNALIKKAQSLIGKFQDDNKEIDAWVQAKITKAADYINSVHDYLTNSKQDVDEDARASDEKSFFRRSYIDAEGKVIPSTTVTRKTDKVIIKSGNPNDGK